MLKDVTRARLIQVWFAIVLLVGAMLFVLGARITMSTAAVLVTLCLVPPVMTLMLWPGAQPPTAGEVLRGGRERRD